MAAKKKSKAVPHVKDFIPLPKDARCVNRLYIEHNGKKIMTLWRYEQPVRNAAWLIIPPNSRIKDKSSPFNIQRIFEILLLYLKLEAIEQNDYIVFKLPPQISPSSNDSIVNLMGYMYEKHRVIIAETDITQLRKSRSGLPFCLDFSRYILPREDKYFKEIQSEFKRKPNRQDDGYKTVTAYMACRCLRPDIHVKFTSAMRWINLFSRLFNDECDFAYRTAATNYLDKIVVPDTDKRNKFKNKMDLIIASFNKALSDLCEKTIEPNAFIIRCAEQFMKLQIMDCKFYLPNKFDKNRRDNMLQLHAMHIISLVSRFAKNHTFCQSDLQRYLAHASAFHQCYTEYFGETPNPNFDSRSVYNYVNNNCEKQQTSEIMSVTRADVATHFSDLLIKLNVFWAEIKPEIRQGSDDTISRALLEISFQVYRLMEFYEKNQPIKLFSRQEHIKLLEMISEYVTKIYLLNYFRFNKNNHRVFNLLCRNLYILMCEKCYCISFFVIPRYHNSSSLRFTAFKVVAPKTLTKEDVVSCNNVIVYARQLIGMLKENPINITALRKSLDAYFDLHNKTIDWVMKPTQQSMSSQTKPGQTNDKTHVIEELSRSYFIVFTLRSVINSSPDQVSTLSLPRELDREIKAFFNNNAQSQWLLREIPFVIIKRPDKPTDTMKRERTSQNAQPPKLSKLPKPNTRNMTSIPLARVIPPFSPWVQPYQKATFRNKHSSFEQKCDVKRPNTHARNHMHPIPPKSQVIASNRPTIPLAGIISPSSARVQTSHHPVDPVAHPSSEQIPHDVKSPNTHARNHNCSIPPRRTVNSFPAATNPIFLGYRSPQNAFLYDEKPRIRNLMLALRQFSGRVYGVLRMRQRSDINELKKDIETSRRTVTAMNDDASHHRSERAYTEIEALYTQTLLVLDFYMTTITNTTTDDEALLTQYQTRKSEFDKAYNAVFAPVSPSDSTVQSPSSVFKSPLPDPRDLISGCYKSEINPSSYLNLQPEFVGQEQERVDVPIVDVPIESVSSPLESVSSPLEWVSSPPSDVGSPTAGFRLTSPAKKLRKH